MLYIAHCLLHSTYQMPRALYCLLLTATYLLLTKKHNNDTVEPFTRALRGDVVTHQQQKSRVVHFNVPAAGWWSSKPLCRQTAWDGVGVGWDGVGVLCKREVGCEDLRKRCGVV